MSIKKRFEFKINKTNINIIMIFFLLNLETHSSHTAINYNLNTKNIKNC